MKIELSNFKTILFLIFLVLKLTGNIDWSWWWVFSPFWIPLLLLILILLIIRIEIAFKVHMKK